MNEHLVKFGDEEGWIEMHKAQTTPWNLSRPAFALEAIADRIPKAGRFLVPGCGTGYDAEFLATLPTREVVGLDLSELVISANIVRTSKIPNLSFIAGNFFTNPQLVEGSFDCIFDYTFLCALHPCRRKDWKTRMEKLLAPGAMLITLMFPLVSEPINEAGPPYSLSVEIYQELLKGFECLSIDDCISPPKRQGKEKIGLWRRI